MPRPSTIERHPERNAIEAALLDPAQSYRTVSDRFGPSVTALKRHKAEKMPGAVVAAVEAGAVEAKAAAVVRSGVSIVEQVTELHARTLAILDRAERGGDLRTALAAIKEARANVVLIGEMMGEIERPPQSVTWQVVTQQLTVGPWGADAPPPAHNGHG